MYLVIRIAELFNFSHRELTNSNLIRARRNFIMEWISTIWTAANGRRPWLNSKLTNILCAVSGRNNPLIRPVKPIWVPNIKLNPIGSGKSLLVSSDFILEISAHSSLNSCVAFLSAANFSGRFRTSCFFAQSKVASWGAKLSSLSSRIFLRIFNSATAFLTSISGRHRPSTY